MKVSDLQHLFDRSKSMPRIFNQCVNLMERFEIALRISDTNLLIPSMLPQRYEEGQRTADFGNCLSGIDDQGQHGVRKRATPTPRQSPISSLSRNCNLAVTTVEITLTLLVLLKFRRLSNKLIYGISSLNASSYD